MSSSRPTPPRGRVRWGNVGRTVLVLVALAALIAWPRGRPAAGPPSSYAPVPVAPAAPSRPLPHARPPDAVRPLRKISRAKRRGARHHRHNLVRRRRDTVTARRASQAPAPAAAPPGLAPAGPPRYVPPRRYVPPPIHAPREPAPAEPRRDFAPG